MRIEITTNIGCSVKCSYCPQDLLLSKYSGNKMLSFEKFTEYMRKIPNSVGINFSGFSEPFDNPDCYKMIDYCINKDYRVSVFTVAKKLRYQDVMVLNRREVDLHIHKKNETDLQHITNKYELIIVGNNSQATQKIISRAGNLGFVDETECKIGDCIAKRYYQPVLLPNGKMVVCCMDYGLEHIIGDMNKNDLSEIMTGDVLKEFIISLHEKRNEFCKRCFRCV